MTVPIRSASWFRAYGRAIAAGLFVGGAPAQAQQPPGSLVVNPQQGATPRPSAPPPALPIPVPANPIAASPTPSPSASLPIGEPPAPPRIGGGTSGPPVPAPTRVPTPMRPTERRADGLPAPSGDPLRIDAADDPVLRLARAEVPMASFAQAITEAVRRNPTLGEALAQVDEAAGVRGEARSRGLPVADLSLSSFQVISRDFSNDPDNVLERSRPRQRTDGLARVQQPLFNWGSIQNRIRASEARLESARASVENAGTQVALTAISAWYSVYGYRALTRLADAFVASQRDLRRSLDERIAQGVAAPGDAAQVDSYLASAEAQLADFRRRLASAEAQYTAVIGSAPSADLSRAPAPALGGISSASLPTDTERLPAVRAARLDVDAARRDVRALDAERLPQLSGAVDAGRYGVFETARDYDVRGSLTLSLRLGGGGAERAQQARARLGGADARLRRTQVEAQRDAAIALADVAALADAQASIGENYVASRRSRDVLAERFRVSRGTLFDLLSAEVNYFGVAARYLQTLIELDTARYALLARTGRLLPAIGLDPATLDNR